MHPRLPEYTSLMLGVVHQHEHGCLTNIERKITKSSEALFLFVLRELGRKVLLCMYPTSRFREEG
jgi:hypothetical protein